LDYAKPVSTGVQAKILIGSFSPFSTASTHSGHRPRPLPERVQIDTMSRLEPDGTAKSFLGGVTIATLVTPTNLQKMEFDVTTAEGASRVTIVTGLIETTPNLLRAYSTGPLEVQSQSYKVFLDPTLAPGKFRKATAMVSVAAWATTTNALATSTNCGIVDAQATLDDESNRVQLIIDVTAQAQGNDAISQLFSANFQVTTLAVI
jgi:hypothetical protein